MSITVRIPASLTKLTRDQAEVAADGGNVTELVESLERSYPGMKQRLCDESGKPRRFMNIYVNAEDVRFLKQWDTPVKDGDEVSIIQAIAGG